MTPSRRSKPSRAWQVEQLEDRALLTTIYGPAPASLEVTSAPSAPSAWWTSGFSGTTSEDRGQLALSPARPAGLTLAFSTNNMQLARSALPSMRTDVFDSVAMRDGSRDAYHVIEGRIDRIPGEPAGPPPPYFTIAIRGLPGSVPPGRGIIDFSRFRDDNREGGPPRFGSRPLLLVISPDSYWENGLVGKPNDSFSFAEIASFGDARSESSAATEPTTSEARERSQAPASPNLTILSAESSESAESAAGNLTIWVDGNAKAGDTSLSSLLLSLGEFEPGALFPQDDLPELTALLSSLLNEWLDESADLSLPLSDQFQQITKLDPLDESSLALTATLLTVSSAPQTGSGGPGSASTENALTEASLAAPPSWAGFVIGLDEAFEANRLATRRWPSTTRPQDEAKPSHEASEAARTVEQSAADKAIESLNQEQQPPPEDAVDHLFLPLPEDENQDTTGRENRWSTAARASLSLAIAPALWAERLGQVPSRHREPRNPDDRAAN
ncbi:hypothetical protein V5E97_23700 [Singulisphaera sp. Ch08]|uniref:Uncharacterized protein n=1 Tax=Singulisphaera sp. Ch08 TaxID=3120278 RepID=A0AAU7C8P4_9BACT